MTNNRRNIQQYAMLMGTVLGAFWIGKFILFPLGMTTSFLLFLFIGLTIYVPVLSYKATQRCRDVVCDGSISFGQAWWFHIQLYIFASLLTAVAHYIYFRFIDNGFIVATYEQQLNELASSPIVEFQNYAATYREALNVIANLSPIDLVMQLLTTNVMAGIFIGIPIALMISLRKGKAKEVQTL